MVVDALSLTLSAVADPTRGSILQRLTTGPATVVELAAPFEISQQAVSKHLKVLEHAGLIARGRDAQRRPCWLQAKPLAEASAWLEGYRQFWETTFQRLDALLEELKADPQQPK
jgi:DNA-binding transcriptional ArsR family regulator